MGSMTKAAGFSLVLYSALVCILSKAESISLKPQPLDSFNLSLIQNVGNCSYRVITWTSCTSPKFTRDQISLAFGDAFGNEIYVPRLDDSSTNTFEQCSTDVFRITGPCAYEICYMYLYRSGPDGWKPESLEISGYNSNPVRFDCYAFIPSDIWYGFNLCASSAHVWRIQGWIVYMIFSVAIAKILL